MHGYTPLISRRIKWPNRLNANENSAWRAPGYDARLIAEGLIWQSERIFFRVYAETPGAMMEEDAKAVGLELWMRTIYLSDDPDPQAKK